MRPLYTAFYTRGTLYEHEAARLRASLDKFGLEHDIRGIDSRGDWAANAGYTATHVLNMMDAYPKRPIVQLDADAIVWQPPGLFSDLTEQGIDIAVHYRRGVEMLNGTMWVAPSGRKLIERYRDLVAGGKTSNEQKMLQQAIDEMAGEIRVYRLPASYCFIFDIMKDDLDGAPVIIEHLQASRETNARGSEHLRRRHERVKEIDGQRADQ